MATVYLSLGSNIDRFENISAALDGLSAKYGELVISSVFESEAVGFDGDPFLNLVVGIDSDNTVGELFAELRALEFANGRSREGAKFSSRTLDIDILTYDAKVGDIDRVVLPREEILFNAFVLQPLAEIAPQTCHPSVGTSYAQLWAEFDKSKQKLWPIDFKWQGRLISRAQ